MRCILFFQIETEHPYFSGKPADLIVLPDNQTIKLLKNRHFFIKKTAKGIKVLLLMNEESKALPALEINDVLVFNVFPISDSVRELTDTSTVENGNMMLFSNEGSGMGNVGLVQSETLQKGMFRGFPAMARVEIKGSEVALGANVPPPLYRVLFNSKSIKWKYYLLSNPENTGIVIESRDEQLKFEQVEIKDGISDEILTSLMSNFPDTQLLIYESGTAIPYMSKPIKDIKLMQNGEVLIKHLPNPQLHDRGIQIIKIK